MSIQVTLARERYSYISREDAYLYHSKAGRKLQGIETNRPDERIRTAVQSRESAPVLASHRHLVQSGLGDIRQK